MRYIGSFPSCVLSVALLAAATVDAQPNVLTSRSDNARTAHYPAETILTPATVGGGQFGALYQYAVDGEVYTQPLYVTGLSIPAIGVHNVVYFATQHDSVYAFDADNPLASPIWHVSFIDSAAGITPVSYTDVGGSHDIYPEIGITSTPVIDLASSTIYVVAKTKEPSGIFQRLHALDIATGTERPGSPVVIAAAVSGVGAGSLGGTLSFDPLRENQRVGLLLLNGAVYIAWSSHGGTPPYHGWVMGYDATTLQQIGVFSDTPDAVAGGIWMGGCGLAADADGDIYFGAGNGSFDANVGGNDYGESLIKLSTNGGLHLSDYFTPYNQLALSNGDYDFGSGGTLLLPDQTGAHPHLAVAAGKIGTIYLVDRDNLGHFNAVDDSQIVQSLPNAIGADFGTPTFWNDKLYYAAANDVPKAFQMSDGLFSPIPVSQGTQQFGFPGASPAISANGTQDAILWMVESDGYRTNSAAILHAYDPDDLSTELYDSNLAGDAVAIATKFAVPTIANGKVYVGGRNAVTVFGLRAAPTPSSTATALIAPTPTATPTPPVEATPTIDPTPTAYTPCAGDCNHDNVVSVDELVLGVRIDLGDAALDQCPAFDVNGDGEVTLDEILRAVNSALQDCFLSES
ncbi:MAG TPA: EF-hand domain-containing protein [Candidatus Acidoferrales bacterium]|nr:EF-hand domain-containing protein [Candidatus Acidoferrales bacterium]